MGGGDGHALIQRRGAHHRQIEGPAPVHPVDLHSGLKLHAPLQGDEAQPLGQLHGVVHAVPLRFPLVQEGLVALAVVKDGFFRGLIHHVPAVLFLVQQRVPQLLPRRFFFHVYKSSLQRIDLNSSRACSSRDAFSPSLRRVWAHRSSNQADGFWALTRARA